MAAEHAGPAALRRLLDAVVAVGSDLDLRVTLRKIVEAAASLVDARYGALGVLDESGTRLADFITVGVDDDARAEIGHPPKGLGILGSLIADATPLRLADLRESDASVGFPHHHPPMRSFLGVPVRIGAQVFGNLYLTDKRSAEVFTDVDEELVVGLAGAAGIAIENARLYERGRRREAALDALRQISLELMLGADGQYSLGLVAAHALELARTDVAVIVLPGDRPDELAIVAGAGEAFAEFAGTTMPRTPTICADVIRTGEAVVLEDASNDERVNLFAIRRGMGPAMFVPLPRGAGSRGVLVVGRAVGEPPFGDQELDIVRSFATQAGIVLEHEQSRQEVERLALLRDQERIGRDLHDSVIQRLFAVGLSMQATLAMIEDETIRDRLSSAVDEIDLTVREIRTVIFGVDAPRTAARGLRTRVLDLGSESARVLGFEPSIVFDGVIDAGVAPAVGEQLLSTLREALSNVARHAHASRVEIAVVVDGDLELRVVDDGVGVPVDVVSGGRGLASMRERAAELRGTFAVERGATGGSSLRWRVPLD